MHLAKKEYFFYCISMVLLKILMMIFEFLITYGLFNEFPFGKCL